MPFGLLPEIEDSSRGINIRLTRNATMLNIISLGRPTTVKGEFRIPGRLPILPGDEMTLLGHSVHWRWDAVAEEVVIQVDEYTLDQGFYAWVFKVSVVRPDPLVSHVVDEL